MDKEDVATIETALEFTVDTLYDTEYLHVQDLAETHYETAHQFSSKGEQDLAYHHFGEALRYSENLEQMLYEDDQESKWERTYDQILEEVEKYNL